MTKVKNNQSLIPTKQAPYYNPRPNVSVSRPYKPKEKTDPPNIMESQQLSLKETVPTDEQNVYNVETSNKFEILKTQEQILENPAIKKIKEVNEAKRNSSKDTNAIANNNQDAKKKTQVKILPLRKLKRNLDLHQ